MEYRQSPLVLNSNQYNTLNLSTNNNLSNDNATYNTSYNSNPSSVVEDMNTSQSKNNTGIGAPQQPEPEEGIMTRMFNYIKNINWPWKIEEEEYIDAHGFKAKRPKHKIPLRKKEDQYQDEINKAGSDGFSYASQNSGFGNIFL